MLQLRVTTPWGLIIPKWRFSKNDPALLTQRLQATVARGQNKLTLLPEKTLLLLWQLHTCLSSAERSPPHPIHCTAAQVPAAACAHRQTDGGRSSSFCSSTVLCTYRKCCSPSCHNPQQGQFRQADTVVEYTLQPLQPVSTALANTFKSPYRVSKINWWQLSVKIYTNLQARYRRHCFTCQNTLVCQVC